MNLSCAGKSISQEYIFFSWFLPFSEVKLGQRQNFKCLHYFATLLCVDTVNAVRTFISTKNELDVKMFFESSLRRPGVQ
jgi:hypothetical protein